MTYIVKNLIFIDEFRKKITRKIVGSTIFGGKGGILVPFVCSKEYGDKAQLKWNRKTFTKEIFFKGCFFC